MLISETKRLLDKYRPLFLGLVLLSFCSVGHGQTYSPSVCCTVSNKAFGAAQAVSTDGRSWFYDATNFVMRDYNGTTEVFSYLNLAKYRSGHFPIFVHTGGVLQGNGVWVGGSTLVYWFKDSTGNANLVRWYTDSTGVPGGPFFAVANNLSEGNAGLIKGNLALDNVDNTSDAQKNAATVTLTNHTIDGNNNTLLHISNSALTNNSIGLTLNNTGATPQVTTTPAALGTSLVVTVPWTNGSDSGFLRGTDWTAFHNKNDSATISNDSLYNWVNGTRTLQSVIAGTGGVNTVNGTNASLLFSPSTGNVLGQVNPAFAFNWTGQHTFTSLAPIFSTLTTAGGIFYGNGSGQLLQSGGGTTGQILESSGGTAPLFFTPDAATVEGWLGFTPLSAALPSAQIFVGNGSNIAAPVTPSGDWTIGNTGVNTIGPNKVTYAKIQASSQRALLGATGAGNYQEITLGTGLAMAGTVLNAFADTGYNGPWYLRTSVVNANAKAVSARTTDSLTFTQIGNSLTEIAHVYEQPMKFLVGKKYPLKSVGFVQSNLDVQGPYNMTCSGLAGSGFVDSVTEESFNGFARWGGAGTSELTYEILPNSSPYGDANFSSITVYYLQQPGGGSFTINVNSTNFTKSTAGSFSVQQYVISGIPETGTQSFTYNVTTPSTAGVMLLGFTLGEFGKAGATINRVGHSGWKASDYTHLDSVIYKSELALISGDVISLELGTNDQFANVDTAVYYREMDTLVGWTVRACPNKSYALVGVYQPSITNTAQGCTPYNNALQRLAKKWNIGFYNDSIQMGPFYQMVRNGEIQTAIDSIHLTYSGGIVQQDGFLDGFSSFDQTMDRPIFSVPVQINVPAQPTGDSGILYTNGDPVMTVLGANRYQIGKNNVGGSLAIQDTLNQAASGDAIYNVSPSGTYLKVNNVGGNKHTQLAFENATSSDFSSPGEIITGVPELTGDTAGIWLGGFGNRFALSINRAPEIAPNNYYLDVWNHDDGGHDMNVRFANDAKNGGFIGPVGVLVDCERLFNGSRGNFFGNTDGLQVGLNLNSMLAWQFTNRFTNKSEQCIDFMSRAIREGGDVPVYNWGSRGADGHFFIGDSLDRNINRLLQVAGSARFNDTVELANLTYKPLLDTTLLRPILVDDSGNIFKTDFASIIALGTPAGTWTPSVTAGTNIPSGTGNSSTYSKTGSVVQFSGSATVTVTAANTASTFSISLPPIASTFTAITDANGTVGANAALSPNPLNLVANTSSGNTMNINFGTGASTGSYIIFFSGQYLVH